MRSRHSLLSIFILFALLLSDSAQAQTNNTVPKKKRIKPIHTELSVGGRLATDGWSLFLDKGWVKSDDRKKDLFYDVKLFQIEFSEKKHPKEKKGSNNLGPISTEGSKPFIYGKVNNFYTLKLGYGGRKMIAGKPDPGAVSIHLVYLGGLAVGFQKPYYIEAYVSQGGGALLPETITYTDSTQEAFLARQYIIGSAGFSEGLSEIQFKPGVHAKLGAHFDFGVSRTSKLAIETGASIEYYFSDIKLMAEQTDRPYFANLYMSFQIGKRWPKKK